MSAGEQFPTKGLKSCVWSLSQRQTSQYGRSGNSQVIKLGEAFWRVKFEFENLTDADFRYLTSFIARRKGRMVSFAAYRPDRLKGLQHSGGVVPSAFSVSGDTLTVTMPGGQHFSHGDMISYAAASGGRYVGEVTEITSASGGTTVMKSEPSPVAAAGTHDAQSEFAWGLFTLEPDSVNISEPFEITKRVSFTARQVEP